MAQLLSNNEIKLIRSLSNRKYRDSLGLFTVEGEKLVNEALASGFQIERIVRREDVGEQTMSRISSLDSPSPVLAIVRKPSLEAAPEATDGLCLALDSIRDPGNMGTIIRLADWFGIDTVFTSRDSVDIFNTKTIQATMGAIFRKKVYCTDIPALCDAFRALGRNVYGTFLDGDDIYGSQLDPAGLIVMGNESRGISPEVASRVSARLLIPSFAPGPTAESLNVATATAITLSEFKRRTR